MNRAWVFVRILQRSIAVRRGSTLTTLVAVMVAAATTTAILNLYMDFEAKLQKEFRGYGANIIITSKTGPSQPLPLRSLQKVDAAIGAAGVAAPFAYAVARTETPAGTPVVVAGANFERVRRLDSWWSVSAWPSNSSGSLFGERVARLFGTGKNPLLLTYDGHPLLLSPTGVLKTGGAEDSRIYIPLGEFQRWTGLQPTSIEVAVNGSASDINSMIASLRTALPSAEVSPVRQVLEAEGNVLSKSRAIFLACTVLIIVTVALCMLGTLTASVLERRKDFALMKALGASQPALSAFFVVEAAVVGLAGSVVGIALGLLIAKWIGEANFHAQVAVRFYVLPIVLGGSLVLSILAALFPLTLLKDVEPAGMLKGS